jgi:hypothetical protein
MTETEFLAQKSKAVEAALRTSVKEIISRAEDTVNPLEWTRDHPFIAMGTALFGGFFLARELKEMGGKRVVAAAKPKPAENVEQEVAGTGWMIVIAREIYDLVKPMIKSVIASKMAEAVSESQNGNAPQNGDPSPQNSDSDNQSV